ncbi:hypothetical protein V8F20_010576 [Naviculisporaceae sp. PSN 640]
MSNRGPHAPGVSGGRSNQPCHEFRQKGRCRYGARCRYSHDYQTHSTRASPDAPANSRRAADPSRRQYDGKLREWKRLLVQGEPPSQPTPDAVQRFFSLGFDLMDGDLGAAHEAIKLMATDPGLSFIKALSDRQAQTVLFSHTSLKVTLWPNAVRPLFRLLSHPRFSDSAVLEQEVAICFNFLLGVGGTRIERLCGYVTYLLSSWDDRVMQPLSKMEVVELSLAVLSKILDFNTTTIVNERFAKLVSGFSTILNQSPATEPDDEFSQRQASKYLDYIQRRLRVGNDIADYQGPSPAPVAREGFVLRRDLPGSLSADGPRHDNDHAEITKIKILPTYEEIVSPRAEYLPTRDPSKWHIQGILGRLDREFRLIREDTVGQLRDAVRDLLEAIRNPGNSRQGQAGKSSARTVSYDAPELVGLEFERHGGLEMTVKCSQIPALRKADIKFRRQWWDQCKRLQAGALVCVLDASGTILFCAVSDSTMRSINDKKGPGRTKDTQGGNTTTPLTLSDDADFLFLKLQLISPSGYEIRQALRWFQPVESSPRRYLVEFPGVLLASFHHTLTALQQMYRKPDIPFHNILAPAEHSPDQVLKPPQYARAPGFTFDARCLTENNIQLSLASGNPANPTLLEEKTVLDPTQSAALDDSLARELALIQGPPGTGKSFTGEKLIKLLLANRNKAQLGPILCVCYTNHALDQLLEHLLDAGTEGIIRIGSRSKSARLEDLNLRVVAQQADRTKTERKNLYELEKEQIPEKVKEATDALQRLATSQHWRTVEVFLRQSYPNHHQELFGDGDEDGWKTVSHNPERTIDRWLKSGVDIRTSRPVDTLKSAQLTSMAKGERRLLYRFWLKSIRDPILTEIVNISREHSRMVEQRNRLRGDVDLRCLQEAKVVGVTTTGLARQLETLRKLRCKVLVCEEAGEVLEAHILTALLPSVEHAILIGDHLQLRPQIQNYQLQSVNPRGEQYSLDVSLFERLVQPPSYKSNGSTTTQLPFSVLETQRRMHPSISDLVRKTLYPALKDGPNVLTYPEVVGMRKRLFWMHHDFPEAGSANSQDPVGTSHTNTFEVDMTIALVCHLVRQGEYGKDDIAVITPYLGQLQKLRRSMQSMFEICLNDRDQDELECLESNDPDGNASVSEVSPRQLLKGQRSGVAKTALLKSIRVATVDNFQGEEAKVVIISLVRSNPQQNCGFLRTSNRINVLLSRAKHGMYIIGNANTYGNVPMWTAVLDMLKQEGNFGTAFELQCPRHPATPLQVSNPDHFMQFSPESGCNLPCDKRLRCGHSCTGRCHSQPLHDALKCLEACPRPLDGGSCDHPCPLRCGDNCPAKCVVPLTGLSIALPCGHKITSAKCWETRDLAGIRCQAQVYKAVPGCGHKVQVKCHVDVNDASYRCLARCGHTWSTCGHTCASLCYLCHPDRKKDSQGRVNVAPDHPTCLAKCGRTYKNCRHSCEKKCHGEDKACPPCKKPCEVRCGHSKCSKECNEPCAPCAETKCHSRCPHGGCTLPCAAPCNWVPCSRRCEKKLSCGHRCPSVCGESCPASKYCQECASEAIKATCVDFLEMKDYRDIDLNEEPCIFPDCGHFLTLTSMDGQMDMSGHYTLDGNGLPVGINRASEPFSMDQGEPIRVCPTCRGSLRNIARYGRIVRRGMLDEATKKFISWSSGKYLGLAEQVVAEQERLATLEMPKSLRRSAAAVVAAAKPTAASSSNASKWVSARDSRLRQLEYLQVLVQPDAEKKMGRYAAAIKLWGQIFSFAGQVRKEEQPFQRVADLVRHSNRLRRNEQNSKRISSIAAKLRENDGTDDHTTESHNETDSHANRSPASGMVQTPGVGADEMEMTDFVYDDSVIQLKGHLLATSLLLKCEIMVFEDLLRLLSGKKVALPTTWPPARDGNQKHVGRLGSVLGEHVDIGVYLRECERMVKMGETAKHPKEWVLGHLYYARFCGFAIALAKEEGQAVASQLAGGSKPVAPVASADDNTEGESSDNSKRKTKLKEDGLSHLAAARAVTEQYPSTVAPPSTLVAEIDAAERFLNEGTFYEAVSAAELRAVYEAMSREFRGTGHWYTCVNGHPFTVGECGMPMQQARCPECGGVVGGTNHQNAPGVRRDETMEQMARGVEGLRF